jgi:hypothetical protein
LSKDEIESDGHAPNLDRPGKPLDALIKGRDGKKVVYPLPQTKWDNCMSLTRELEGQPLTNHDLTRWQLTRREYEHFLALYAQSTNASGVSLPSLDTTPLPPRLHHQAAAD